jgi:hypothetical protein
VVENVPAFLFTVAAILVLPFGTLIGVIVATLRKKQR